MASPTRVLPIECPFHRFHTNAYFVDAPQPALIDTGASVSPLGCIEPALRKVGRRLAEVRWILLTHGHPDHLGGAHAVWQETEQRAEVAIHEADAALLRSRHEHIPAADRGKPEAAARHEAILMEVIGGEMEPTRQLVGGERLGLGRGTSIEVVHTPGHSAGSVTFLLDGPEHAFVGDAVQIFGGVVNRFPSFEDPTAYRHSLETLVDDVRPKRVYMGHRFVHADGSAVGGKLEGAAVDAALRASLEMERRLARAARDHLATSGLEQAADGPYGEFAGVAADVGYTGDPTAWPSPFFITMNGYRAEFATGGGDEGGF